MRVIAAGLFVFVGMIVGVALFGGLGWLDSLPVWVLAPSLVLWMITLYAAAHKLFNRKGARLLTGSDKAETLREYEARGEIVDHEFTAIRAFGVAEFEDEGPHYFIELKSGDTLYLGGQYLYDYEPISDDPDLNRPRKFPCTEFTVRRHKDQGYVFEILCRGPVLEPEVMAPAFSVKEWGSDRIPEDGQIITDRRYDALKSERAGS